MPEILDSADSKFLSGSIVAAHLADAQETHKAATMHAMPDTLECLGDPPLVDVGESESSDASAGSSSSDDD